MPVNRDKLLKYGKRAGIIVLALVALDIAAGAAAVVLGVGFLGSK